jgi:hypothetical protein
MVRRKKFDELKSRFEEAVSNANKHYHIYNNEFITLKNINTELGRRIMVLESSISSTEKRFAEAIKDFFINQAGMRNRLEHIEAHFKTMGSLDEVLAAQQNLNKISAMALEKIENASRLRPTFFKIPVKNRKQSKKGKK